LRAFPRKNPVNAASTEYTRIGAAGPSGQTSESGRHRSRRRSVDSLSPAGFGDRGSLHGEAFSVISPDVLFLGLAGIAFLGFVLDSLFHRLRVSSILPLLLLGLFLALTGVVSRGTVGVLTGFIPYISAITVAFILFAVGLEIRYSELLRVLGRANAYTFAVQVATGVAIAFSAFYLIHWNLLDSFVFGFALSGPSTVAVPVLVRVVRLPKTLRTSLLYESVISDVLQLIVPVVLLGLIVSGSFSPVAVVSTVLWTILGSIAGGIVAALAWLAVLDRLRAYTRGFTWTLTISMVLATYGAGDLLGLTPAIVVFVFGLTLGNAALLDANRRLGTGASVGWGTLYFRELRARLGLSTGGLDIEHILQVQKEVSFFAASFFFVYIGLLFKAGQLTLPLLGLTALVCLAMLALRYAFTPLLSPFFDPQPRSERAQRTIVTFNISRGLAPAVVATLPQTLGIVIPGFVDAIFLGILATSLVSSLGILALYRPDEAGVGRPLVEPPGPGPPGTTAPPGDPDPLTLGEEDPPGTAPGPEAP
jgi:NhaP-type Na+/H+ or K+/H+ antiporter